MLLSCIHLLPAHVQAVALLTAKACPNPTPWCEVEPEPSTLALHQQTVALKVHTLPLMRRGAPENVRTHLRQREKQASKGPGADNLNSENSGFALGILQ